MITAGCHVRASAFSWPAAQLWQSSSWNGLHYHGFWRYGESSVNWAHPRMASCGSTMALHPVATWGCNRTAAELLNPVSRRSTSGSVFKNVALRYFTPVGKSMYIVSGFPSRATSTQAPQVLVKSAFDRLNAEQMAAVQTEADCVRVVAGPGSGKTLVLTHRIAHLIENRGVDPSNMLCLTFTNKAKNELQERLKKLLGDRSSKLMIGTFHSVCVRMLRESVRMEDVGVDKDFVIYDTQDSTKVIIMALETLGQEWTKTPSLNPKESDEEPTDKKKKKPDAQVIRNSSKLISQIKEYRLVNFLAKQNELYKLPTMPLYLQSGVPLFKRYENILRSYNAVDFDDLIHLTVRILFQRSDLCRKYQNRWRYVLADEFQDTDRAQYVLVRLLCATNQKLFVVGDVDQAIYGWRGADYRNMDDLQRHFQSLTTFELRKNYRSSKNILKLASGVINRSTRSASSLRPLTLQPMKSRGTPVTVVYCSDSDQEAVFVVRKISELVARKQASYGSFGVLYRTRAQSEAFQLECIAKQIPYTKSGSSALFSYKEVKDLRAYLQLVWNPQDRVALDRIINTPPRGLGPKTLKRVGQWASDLNISLYQALQKISEEEMSHKDLGITRKARNAILEFYKAQEDLLRLSKTDYVSTLVQEIIERTKLLQYYGNDGKCAWHLQLFQESAVLWDSEHGHGRSALCSFLEEVALSASLDQEDGEKLDEVKLSTIHAAKGLEFDYVFVTGAEDGTLPLHNSDIEEERRLFYVGVTRAKKNLVITTRMRTFDHRFGFQKRKLSPFLDDKTWYQEETSIGSCCWDPNGYEQVYHDLEVEANGTEYWQLLLGPKRL